MLISGGLSMTVWFVELLLFRFFVKSCWPSFDAFDYILAFTVFIVFYCVQANLEFECNIARTI